MQSFCVSATSDKIWNYTELIHFLSTNQNKKIQIDIVPEAICLHNLGLYKLLDCFSFQQVTINTWNPLETHNVYNINFKGKNFWFNQITNVDEDLYQWNLNKIFLCLYHRPTAARLGIASYTKQHYSDHAHMHFSTMADPDSVPQFELDKLLGWCPDSIYAVGKMIQRLPLTLSGTEYYTAFDGYNYTDPLTKFYQDILVDLVVESHVAGNTFFPTEKTIRPMLLKKPFIIFGSTDYLAYLRQMGFRTFADFWDETYDGYQGKERYLRIIKLIDHIAGLSREHLETMYWDMQYTLDHNYQVLTDKKYKTNITPL
jgi:hypothetical protein